MKIERLVISGIYSIKNKANERCYIGQSQNIYMRLGMHLTRLANNKHKNRLLQEEWNQFGSENFEFEILEECSDNISEREMYYITNFADYNIQRDGYRLPMTYFSKERMSKSRSKGYADGTIIKTNKVVHKYALDGSYLESYDSLTEAAKKNGAMLGTISRSCKNGKSAANFMWNFEAKEKIEPYKRQGRGKANKQDLIKLGELMETPEVDNHELSTTLNE